MRVWTNPRPSRGTASPSAAPAPTSHSSAGGLPLRTRDPAHPERFLTLSNVGEPVTITWSGGEQTLERAESILLPAAIGDVTVSPTGAEADLIACYLPDLRARHRRTVASSRPLGRRDSRTGRGCTVTA